MAPMAEPLKLSYGPPVVRQVAAAIAAVHPAFDAAAFTTDTLAGYEALELMPRARQIATNLARHLPADFARTGEILLASFGPPLGATMANGMAPFFYLPHGMVVAERGLGHFELSMRVLHALTQRFTAEFAIRPFLEHHPAATLARLAEWSGDPSEHVRRLVSEGTRPRLPWAPRLRAFQRDPAPVLALLERLKDDPSLYVRRSVANNLNDIGKDHPAVLTGTARRWLEAATPERRWIVGHALRSAVKRGEPEALAVLGYGHATKLELRAAAIDPPRAVIGGKLRIAFELHNPGRRVQRALVDLRVHYVKARGQHAAKVFKLKMAEIPPGEAVAFGKSISLADMTTRRHHPGEHPVEVLVNGQARPLGSFDLRSKP
jgi:3-methyladenine DNA glycosylase AlkC